MNFTSVSPEMKLVESAKRNVTSEQAEGIPEKKGQKHKCGYDKCFLIMLRQGKTNGPIEVIFVLPFWPVSLDISGLDSNY